jgi:hypothetical protein
VNEPIRADALVRQRVEFVMIGGAAGWGYLRELHIVVLAAPVFANYR